MEYKRKCAICGDEFIATNYRVTVCPKDHYLTCPVCGKKYIWNSTKERKGCSRSCSARASMYKKRKTNLERYGTENPMQSKEIQEKARETCRKKYGCDNPMSNHEIAMKSRNARKISYEEVFEKAKKTWMKIYGVDNPSKSPEIIDKITHTFIEKYGVKRAMSVPEFRKKFELSMMNKYGVPYYTQTDEYRHNSHFRISKTNERFSEKLKENNIEFKTEFNLQTKSYDFKVNNNLIEIDPTYTHNIVGNHWNKNGLDPNYHLEKTEIAEKNVYRCIHVFDWDRWDDIIDLVRPTQSVYARQCKIFRLKDKVAKEFIKENHIQGSCRGQMFFLGLVKDDQIYQVMSFGKPRYNKKYSIEILRMCTKRGYRVVGGASRLFKFATENYGFNDIISYCDRSKFNGSVYTKMGMKLSKITPPQEIWSRGEDHITANLLRARGYDQLFNAHYGRGTSNDLLMLEHGWLPIYDCGQYVFTY